MAFPTGVFSPATVVEVFADVVVPAEVADRTVAVDAGVVIVAVAAVAAVAGLVRPRKGEVDDPNKGKRVIWLGLSLPLSCGDDKDARGGGLSIEAEASFARGAVEGAGREATEVDECAPLEPARKVGSKEGRGMEGDGDSIDGDEDAVAVDLT